MNKDDCIDKINVILSDNTKFVQINKDPTLQLKKKLRALIDTVHATSNAPRFPSLIGQYQPGYIYGNAKIHKNKENPPLRPIISQLGTPTYEVAKKLNEIISPYLPSKYLIKSTAEFIDLLQNYDSPQGYLTSLDVESLFTNVPVEETINIIIDTLYKNPTAPPPLIPQELLRSLLRVCTTETPFKSPNGDVYLQTDGVSMGSPLGPLFANFYMGFIENNIVPHLTNKPEIYTRYVDDIFLIVKNIKVLEETKEKFTNLSSLNFTYEIEQNKSLPFLDVSVTRHQDALSTTVHTKATNSDECINYRSIAPERYKTGVIKTFLHRAYKICNNWTTLTAEIDRIQQLLTNNNFPMKLIEQTIKQFIDRKQIPTTESNTPSINIYYRSQMSSQYKQEERNIKDMVNTHISPTNESEEIKVQIYYKNKKLRNLFIRNNSRTMKKEETSHVVYEYRCPVEECKPSTSYVGYTECSLVDRLRNHAQHGSILEHYKDKHGRKINTKSLVEDTIILRQLPSKEELLLAEALLIKEIQPTLNAQREGEVRVLAIF